MDVVQNQIRSNRVIDSVAEDCKKLFLKFLETFQLNGVSKYVELAKEMKRLEKSTILVSYEDIMQYDPNLFSGIQEEYYRVYSHLCLAVKQFVQDQVEDPMFANRDFFVSFTDVTAVHKVRDLTTSQIGRLIKMRGQVVRSHPVHPELVVGAFRCSDCGTVIRGVEQQFKYTQPSVCYNPQCSNRVKFELITEESKFVDFQKVRIQETQAELPRGSVPRSLEVILRGESVEMAQPGDRSEFIGTLIVIPDVGQLAMPGNRTIESRPGGGAGGRQESNADSGVSGLKALGVRELTYRLAFLACNVIPSGSRAIASDNLETIENLTYETMRKRLTQPELNKIYEMSQDRALFSNLCHSLFPSIHGNEEVKKGILLMMFGGVPKVTTEGTRLRGDLNVCIVGDPSTAKSQFLKQVEQFSARAVYTSGKASSAAGLTAAVVRDEESHEFVIEAGALMLADNGVCCIDEFDKMDARDQVAIHEAMEQQTISITKAGVRATLNARTSILAAANPIGGRYDRAKSLKQNITMTAPIMSRFDLFFVLVDECNDLADYAIAKAIVDLHSATSGAELGNYLARTYSPDEIRRYISFARCFKPKIGMDAMRTMVDVYKRMRLRDTSAGQANVRSAWRITVRQLESLIRLSEATARLNCADVVTEAHVNEASALLSKSIVRVEQPDINLEASTLGQSAIGPAGDSVDPENAMDVDHVDGPAPSEASQAAPVPLKLSYEEYKQMATLLILHTKRIEEQIQEEQEGTAAGMRRSQLINWYLEEMEAEIESEEDLLRKKALVERVIDRLVLQDNVLIKLSRSGLDSDSAEEEDPLLVVHPNYLIE